jgi:NADH-quinone oxidoreductase subunit L
MDKISLLAALIPALPFAAFLAVTAFARRRPMGAALTSIAGTAAAFALSCAVLYAELTAPAVHAVRAEWLQLAFVNLHMGVLVNQLTALMLFIVTFISLLVQVYSIGYMRGDSGFSKFFSFLSLFTFSMLGIVVADNLMQLYIFWELVGLSSYLLIGFWYDKPSAAAAAKKAFVVNRVGDFGFLLGILLLAYAAGTFDFSGVIAFVSSGAVPPARMTLIALLLFCGALGKSAQFPLHVWLPDAMEGPTPVSALIHAATMVAAGVFMVARLFAVFSASPEAMTVIAYIGGFTAVFAASIALVQDDIKRILAYSTLSQLGYMILALGAGGYTAGLFHLATHAFFKALLFLGAGSVIHAVHTNDIWQTGGLHKKMPVTSITMLIASLAISGIFPFSGFWSKDEIFSVLKAGGHTGLYLAAVAAAFMTAFYMFRLYFVTFAGAPGEKSEHAHESPAVMTVPLMVLAFFSVFSGLAALPHAHNIASFLYFGEPERAGLNTGIALTSSAVAVSGILLAWLVYSRKALSAASLKAAAGPLYSLLRNKYYVDEIYMFFIRNVFFVLTAAVKWFDRRAVDGLVMATGLGVRRGGDGLRRTVPGTVQSYALAVFGGMAVILLASAWFHPDLFGFGGLLK